MSVRELTKSAPFVLVLLLAVLIGLPFAVEQIGEATDLFRFPASAWVKGLFVSKPAGGGAREAAKIDWERQRKDLEDFSKWAEGLGTARIAIVRPPEFQIVKVETDPVTSSRCSWRMELLSDTLDLNATQVRNKLMLMCEPADKVAGAIMTVKSLSGGKKGFLVTADNIRGEGRVGLSYDALPPIYYNVKLRRMWFVPVASCRAALAKREGREGYASEVFFPGMTQGLQEGSVISPGTDKCGYRILSISDRCVWFEAFYGVEPAEDSLPHGIWPDFSRVDTMAPTPPPGRLVFGASRCFWPGDAIKLPNSGAYLMVDDFLADASRTGHAVVFRLLDAAMRPVRDLLCVIVREKK